MNFTYLIKILIIPLLIVLFTIFIISLSSTKGESLAYITNQGEDTVSVVSLNDLIVQKKIDVGDSHLESQLLNQKD
jgi:hypothetical protein